jgi:hypothetical protein
MPHQLHRATHSVSPADFHAQISPADSVSPASAVASSCPGSNLVPILVRYRFHGFSQAGQHAWGSAHGSHGPSAAHGQASGGLRLHLHAAGHQAKQPARVSANT